MIDRYIQLFHPPRPKEAHLVWWKERIGSYFLSDITPALIAEGRDWLPNTPTAKGAKRSPSTVVRYIAFISHVFTIGIKEFGWVETSPITNVSKPRDLNGRVRFLNDEEREHLLTACRQSNSPYHL